VSARLFWPDLEPGELAEGWLPDLKPMTAAEVLVAVAKRHPMTGWNGEPARWVYLQEVCATTGLWGEQQRFDAVAIGLTPSVKYARVIYEVKVSRSDWLHELKPRTRAHQQWVDDGSAWGHYEVVHEERPGMKWEAAMAASTEFWYAAPPRCIQPDELPEGAGLLEVRPWGQTGDMRAKVIVPAAVRETPVPGQGFWAAVLRRVAGRRWQDAAEQSA
jgi:hypothetical protein